MPIREEEEVRPSFLKKRSKRLFLFQVFVPPGRPATASRIESFGADLLPPP
jgi:hypothetical protein